MAGPVTTVIGAARGTGAAGRGLREIAAAGVYNEDNAYALAQGKLYYRWFNCIGCHARRFNGEPDRMYTRAERKVRSPEQLLAQVRVCNAELAKNYFPEEEEHVAAYLNLHFYRFKP